jgi:hypothetical protein
MTDPARKTCTSDARGFHELDVIPLPRLMTIAMKLWAPFVPKKRRGAFKQFAGYVLLEPC